ncbi:MAG: MotA/TolQ/ExbB proton channel family protein [Opitutales bacterium]
MNVTPSFWQQALDVWEKGGSLMPVLAALSVYAYYVGFDLWFRLQAMLPSRRDAKTIVHVAANPGKAVGRLHSILGHCLEKRHDRDETRRRFEEARATDASFLGRRIRFLLVLTSVAPLLGLLGTVNGMLLTFDGLSRHIGRKMDLVAGGISEALVTTQAGLLIAIPAFALAHLVSRRRHEWLYLLRRLESHALRANDSIPKTS